MKIATESRQDEDILSEIDPRKYLVLFRDSQQYNEARNRFFENKRVADATQTELTEVFEESDTVIDALGSFNREVRFTYMPSLDIYQRSTISAISDYLTLLGDLQDGGAERLVGYADSPRTAVLELDKMRRRYHLEAAQELRDTRMVPNLKLAEAFVRLIAINKGLSDESELSTTTPKRLQMQLA